MQFEELAATAKNVRRAYEAFEEKKYGKAWSREQLAQGFVGDVGDLMKLVMAKEGIRDIADVEQKLKHELSDCLWSILILADKYEIDLEQSFIDTMHILQKKIESET